MVVEYIRYRVGPERAGGLEAAYGRAAPFLELSPHCLGYELAGCVEEPGTVTVRIEWDSADGHLSGFRRSPEFAGFFGAVRAFVADIEEMRHYDVKLAGGRRVTPAAPTAPVSP